MATQTVFSNQQSIRGLIVKNTFLDIDDHEPTEDLMSRVRSEPCPQRSLSDMSDTSEGDKESNDDKEKDKVQECCSQASTDIDSPCTDAKVPDLSNGVQTYTNWVILTVPQMPTNQPRTEVGIAQSITTGDSACPSASGTVIQRSRLNVAAKAWTPSPCGQNNFRSNRHAASSSRRKKGNGRIVQQITKSSWEMFEEAVDELQQALLTCRDIVVGVQAVEGARGWTLTASVHGDKIEGSQGRLEETAQQALLLAVERMENIFVLSQHNRPFAPMPRGFGTTLAFAADPRQACWEFFSAGVCPNPGNCRWQHPTSQAGIQVIFKPIDA